MTLVFTVSPALLSQTVPNLHPMRTNEATSLPVSHPTPSIGPGNEVLLPTSRALVCADLLSLQKLQGVKHVGNDWSIEILIGE